MAAVIPEGVGKVRQPELLSKVTIDASVNDAILFASDDGIITALDDKSIRIWLRRQTGKYWPSDIYKLETAPTALYYHEPSWRLFCGCDSGLVIELLVANDLNKMTLQCTYFGHQTRIQAVYFSSRHELLLTVCREKKLHWYSTNPVDENHRNPLGTYALSSCGMSITMNELSRQCFIGDLSGNIHFLKINTDNKCETNTILKGHTGSVQNLLWNSETQWLFSGSYDSSVIAWDVGTNQGLALELNGHYDRLVGISYDTLRKLLITCSVDGHVRVWPMNVKRNETPKWNENDSCQICHLPFFWNVRAMWSEKKIGSRQHHCRKCGQAVCDKCSATRKALPLLGYEIEQRICDNCIKILGSDEITPLSSFHKVSHTTTKMDYNQDKKVMITVGTDRIIRVWDMSSVV